MEEHKRLACCLWRPRRRLLRMSHYCDFKRIRARAALRPLARHNSSASCLYSEVYLALPRAGLVNCIFMWASFRVFTLCPLSVNSMQPYSDPYSIPFILAVLPLAFSWLLIPRVVEN